MIARERSLGSSPTDLPSAGPGPSGPLNNTSGAEASPAGDGGWAGAREARTEVRLAEPECSSFQVTLILELADV